MLGIRFAEISEPILMATRRPMLVTVTNTRLTKPMRTSHGGRPSKGQRELLGTRPLIPLVEAARNRADELGLTVSDYLATLIAQDTNLPQFAPRQPEASRMELPIPAA